MDVAVSVFTLPVHLAVVQPTPFCNIDCRYCYLSARSDTRRMSVQTVEHMARFLLSNPNRLDKSFTILWHGGEPTTVPIDFYEFSFNILQRLAPVGVLIRNQFSTNGILLNQSWCELIKRWNVTMRVSIDGPQWLHDSTRVDRSGRGTFDKVMHGIQTLKENGIPFD